MQISGELTILNITQTKKGREELVENLISGNVEDNHKWTESEYKSVCVCGGRERGIWEHIILKSNIHSRQCQFYIFIMDVGNESIYLIFAC